MQCDPMVLLSLYNLSITLKQAIKLKRMLINVVKELIKKLKELILYKKCCNYYLDKNNNLYF